MQQAPRENNFNLLRFVAALLVVFSHSFALSGAAVPVLPLIGIDYGKFAVDIFFIISGYLVTGSLLRKQSAGAFLRARFYRIYPALWVMLIVTVSAAGIFLTHLSFLDFITHHRTHVYLAKCATLISNITYTLPGTFENLPVAGKFNGSLWTLPYELKLYLGLTLIWFAARFFTASRLRVFLLLSGVIVFVTFVQLEHQVFRFDNLSTQLIALFFCGSVCAALKPKIRLSLIGFTGALLLLGLSSCESLGHKIAYIVGLTYSVIYCGELSIKALKNFNLLGDYSYGIYIYAFPIQQTFLLVDPTISPIKLFILSTFAVLICAVLSWHLVEKPCLDRK